jgi:hypothetical protein
MEVVGGLRADQGELTEVARNRCVQPLGRVARSGARSTTRASSNELHRYDVGS